MMEGQFMSYRGLCMGARVNLHDPAAGLESKPWERDNKGAMRFKKTGSQPFNITSSPEFI